MRVKVHFFKAFEFPRVSRTMKVIIVPVYVREHDSWERHLQNKQTAC
jgi:hypothetical protein